MENALSSAVDDVSSLMAVFLTAMPDCLLYDAWIRDDDRLNADEVAAYFGDLVRANREGLKALGSFSADMQVTIESADMLIILKEINADFLCSCVFQRSTPLGMARLAMNRVLERVSPTLPSFEVEKRPRGVRVIEFLNRYAPDPHAVLMRVALRTGLSLDSLQRPEALDEEQVGRLEESTRAILGLETLNL